MRRSWLKKVIGGLFITWHAFCFSIFIIKYKKGSSLLKLNDADALSEKL